jgi:adenine phosphoribosyltransferase
VALTDFIRNIPDFPKPGIQFKDISPLLQDAGAFNESIVALAEPYKSIHVDYVVGIESRGFIFGAPLARQLGVGFVPIRKPGKSVVVVDDLLATGGTMAAACELIDRLEGNICGISFLIELAFLEGRKKLLGRNLHTLITY